MSTAKKDVYTVAAGRFVRIGVAAIDDDGSLSVKLDALPVNGTLQIRDREPASQCGACARVGTNDPSVRVHAPGCANDHANRRFVEITAAHVGKTVFHAFDRSWSVSGFIGRITKQDIGKRVYLVKVNDADPRGDFLQVENDEQRAARRMREREETGFDPNADPPDGWDGREPLT